MEITTLGIDIAKSVFQLHGVDAAGQTVLRKRLRRNQLLDFVSELPRCLVGEDVPEIPVLRPLVGERPKTPNAENLRIVLEGFAYARKRARDLACACCGALRFLRARRCFDKRGRIGRDVTGAPLTGVLVRLFVGSQACGLHGFEPTFPRVQAIPTSGHISRVSGVVNDSLIFLFP